MVMDIPSKRMMPCEAPIEHLLMMGWKPKTMLDIFDVCEKP